MRHRWHKVFAAAIAAVLVVLPIPRLVWGFPGVSSAYPLLGFSAPTALAQEAATPPAQPPPPDLPPGTLNDLPKDVRDRLTAEQLHDLLMARQEAQPPAVAWLIPISFFVATLLIVIAALYANHRKEGLRHATLRLALERGADIPPALISPPRRPKSDLRRGVLLLSVGLSLAVVLLATAPAAGIWTSALIPISLGLGYLIVHRLERGAASPSRADERTLRPADG